MHIRTLFVMRSHSIRTLFVMYLRSTRYMLHSTLTRLESVYMEFIMPNITIALPDALIAQYTAYAESVGMPRSHVMRHMLAHGALPILNALEGSVFRNRTQSAVQPASALTITPKPAPEKHSDPATQALIEEWEPDIFDMKDL